jgi:hypothetical protein
MADEVYKAEKISLGQCLHDGSIETLTSDLMARTLTIIVDTPFHWAFHKLPADTRFQIIGENVKVAEVLDFEPWLGALVPVQGTSYREANEQRRADYEKGRYISSDWNAFTKQIETEEDFQIMTAELEILPSHGILNLGIMSYPNSDYRDAKIQAESFRFFVGDRELSLQDFNNFGSEYWDDWSKQSKAQTASAESASKESKSE